LQTNKIHGGRFFTQQQATLYAAVSGCHNEYTSALEYALAAVWFQECSARYLFSFKSHGKTFETEDKLVTSAFHQHPHQT